MLPVTTLTPPTPPDTTFKNQPSNKPPIPTPPPFINQEEDEEEVDHTFENPNPQSIHEPHGHVEVHQSQPDPLPSHPTKKSKKRKRAHRQHKKSEDQQLTNSPTLPTPPHPQNDNPPSHPSKKHKSNKETITVVATRSSARIKHIITSPEDSSTKTSGDDSAIKKKDEINSCIQVGAQSYQY